MDSATLPLLDRLVRAADLAPVVSTARLIGRGLDNRLAAADLADGERVVLRLRAEGAPSELIRSRFLASYGLGIPRLLAADGNASLYEFAEGVPFGDIVEGETVTDDDWTLVGRALRRVHAVRFPALVRGAVLPDRIVLRPIDPVAELHDRLDGAAVGVRRVLPAVAPFLTELHRLIDAAAPSLRGAPTALLHGDLSLGNILIAPSRATLVDWDTPLIADPAGELATLDANALLANGRGLPRAFFSGYGRGPSEPNTSLHRVVGTLASLASDEWAAFERLDPDLRARTRGWFRALRDWATRMPDHVARLETLPPRP